MNTGDEELKRCPLCGDHPDIIHLDPEINPCNDHQWIIVCHFPHVKDFVAGNHLYPHHQVMVIGRTRDEAVTAWNKRV